MKKILALSALLAFGFVSSVFAADNMPPHPEKYPAHHQDGKEHHDGKDHHDGKEHREVKDHHDRNDHRDGKDHHEDRDHHDGKKPLPPEHH